MRRWLGLAARLYPQSWRERYGVEFEALLDDVELRWSDIGDVLRGALKMQLKVLSSYVKLVAAVAMAGAVLAVAWSFLTPKRYVSSSVVQTGSQAGDPETVDQISHAWQEVASRASLSELIQRPSLDLYRGERNRQPLEDVIEKMKTEDLRLDISQDRGETSLHVSFIYPDRYKAQAVANALTTKILDASRERWRVSPATLPETPLSPNRMLFTFWGLLLGLMTGVLASFLRWRAGWTMKVIGFGLAGWAVAASLSLLIPNRYVSRAVFRVTPAPGADGKRRYMQDAELRAWLRQRGEDVLSDQSLSELIQRPTLDLYHKQREKQALEAVIGLMRKDLGLEILPVSHSAVMISFTYPDRMKAQQVVSALVTKYADAQQVANRPATTAPTPVERLKGVDGKGKSLADGCKGKPGDAYLDCIQSALGPEFPTSPLDPASVADMTHPPHTAPAAPIIPAPMQPHLAGQSLDLLDPASLPETPVSPNRFLLSAPGLLAGLLLGAFALRSKPERKLQPA